MGGEMAFESYLLTIITDRTEIPSLRTHKTAQLDLGAGRAGLSEDNNTQIGPLRNFTPTFWSSQSLPTRITPVLSINPHSTSWGSIPTLIWRVPYPVSLAVDRGARMTYPAPTNPSLPTSMHRADPSSLDPRKSYRSLRSRWAGIGVTSISLNSTIHGP